MSNYAKLATKFTYSANSDYSDAIIAPPRSQSAHTPDECLFRHIDVTNTAYTLDLGAFDSVSGFYIWREDTSGVDVEVTWYTQHGSQANDGANGLAFTASGNVLTDNNNGATFDDNGAVAGRWVRVSSSTADDGLHLIDTVTDGNNLVISPRTTMSDTDPDLAAALSFESKNCNGIAYGQGLRIEDNIVPAGDLVLQSRTAGTVSLWVLVWGS